MERGREFYVVVRICGKLVCGNGVRSRGDGGEKLGSAGGLSFQRRAKKVTQTKNSRGQEQKAG